MALLLHIGAELFGKKDNLELSFPGRPTLYELINQTQSLLTREGNGAPFVIEQLRIYDEVLGRWVDLTREDQLHSYAQIYAFQPDKATQTELRGVLPAPRRPGTARNPAAAMYGGFSQPEDQKEANRHEAIAQHLRSQLGGGGGGRSASPPPYYNASPASPGQHTVAMSSAGMNEPMHYGIHPQQTSADTQREQWRHEQIAQHLNQQLGGGGAHPLPQGTGGNNAHSPPAPMAPGHPSPFGMGTQNSPSQHSPLQHGGGPTWEMNYKSTFTAGTPPYNVNLYPAASPMSPSPLHHMPSPLTGGYPVSTPPAYQGPPMTPLVGGHQGDLEYQKERERHDVISQHLRSQLAHGEHSPVPPPHVETTPHGYYHAGGAQLQQQQYPHTPGNVPPPPFASPVAGLPGVDPTQTAMDEQREKDRHRLIAEHLNRQLAGAGMDMNTPGGANTPGGGGAAFAPSTPYATGQFQTQSMHNMYQMTPPAHGQSAAPFTSPVGDLPGAGPYQGEADAQRERERHELIAKHLNQQLSGAAGQAYPVGGGGGPGMGAGASSPGFRSGSPGNGYGYSGSPVPYDNSGSPGMDLGQAQTEADKEAERHRLVAEHIHSNLAARQ
ncbi:calmodulin-like protein containing EF hand domain [Diplonema papillatum]|nr:calmodulin-like protein containing EF hand domain [Diplonema papillatum]